MRSAGRFLFVALAMFLSHHAAAMYKCEKAGSVTYTDTPCGDGTPLDLRTAPVTNDGDARSRAGREATLLKVLERDRHKREAAELRDLKKASRKSAARHKKCAAHARRQQHAQQEVARTAGLANEKARRKADRVREAYEADCGRWYERELSLAR